MNRIAGFLVFLLIIAAAMPIMADGAMDSLRLSRREAVNRAIAANPQVLAAQEQAEQARARIAEATALPDATFETTLEEETNFFNPGSSTSKDIGIGLTIPFLTNYTSLVRPLNSHSAQRN